MRRWVVVAVMVSALAPACGASGVHRDIVPASAPATTTTAAPTAAIDDASLPQTTSRPTSTDRAFQARMQVLWQAVAAGRPADALPAFFPLAAYLQVKAIRDPAGDWQHRLVKTFDQDIVNLQRSFGGAAVTFLGIDVPDHAAVWVRPGQEFNKIGYWRVYASRVRYLLRGQTRSFPIASLISWRGQWYVVHFARLSR